MQASPAFDEPRSWQSMLQFGHQKVNKLNLTAHIAESNISDFKVFYWDNRGNRMDVRTILERELTTFRPTSGEVESVKIVQRDDGKWYLKLGIGWKSGDEFDVCHYDKRRIKLYSSLVSAVRHICEVYKYDGRIILLPNKGSKIK